MEQLIMAIAAPLARTYGIDKAIELAYEQLGLEVPTQSEIDVLTGGGISSAFSPANLGNFVKRGAVNLGVRSALGGVPLGPLALAGGVAFLGNKFNPLNPNARNYNPNLAGQISFLSNQEGMIGRDQGTGLAKYGPGSVLAGQNVVSMFGTNDYEEQLGNYINKMRNRKNLSKFQQKQLDKARAEIGREMERQQKEVASRARKANPEVYAKADAMGFTDGKGGGFGSKSTGTNEAFSNESGRGRTGYSQGGIASL